MFLMHLLDLLMLGSSVFDVGDIFRMCEWEFEDTYRVILRENSLEYLGGIEYHFFPNHNIIDVIFDPIIGHPKNKVDGYWRDNFITFKKCKR